MIEKYGNLDGIYANINDFTGKTKEKMENGKESAYLSQFLATINTDVPIDCKIEECAFEYPFNNSVRQYFIKNNFKSLIKR
jgi:DNA polymerase-1